MVVVGVTVGLIALVCDMLLRSLAWGRGSRSASSDKKGGGRRHPDHPADRRRHPRADRRQGRADGGVAPARVSCRRHVGAVHPQSQRTDLGAGQARREGRALSRSESCHAASLHRQPGADLHQPKARRCWPRIPTLPIASLACAIWALSLPAAAFDLQGHRGARGPGAREHAGGLPHRARPRRHDARDRSRRHQGRRRWSSATTRCSIPTWCAARRPMDRRRRPDHPVAHAGRAQALRHRPHQSRQQVRPAIRRPEAGRRRALPDDRRSSSRRPGRTCASTSRSRPTRPSPISRPIPSASPSSPSRRSARARPARAAPSSRSTGAA